MRKTEPTTIVASSSAIMKRSCGLRQMYSAPATMSRRTLRGGGGAAVAALCACGVSRGLR